MPLLTQFQSNDRDFQLMQNSWGATLNPVLKNPLVNGILLKNINLSVGSNIVNHKLDRAYQGWFSVGTVPIYPNNFQAWSNWTPSYSASGSMTYTSVTTDIARFMVDQNKCFFYIRAFGTTGGTASTRLIFTLPTPAKAPPAGFPASSTFNSGHATVADTTTDSGFYAIVEGSLNSCAVFKPAVVNWPLASDVGFFFNGIYEVDPSTSNQVSGSDIWEGVSTDKTKFLNLICSSAVTTNIYAF